MPALDDFLYLRCPRLGAPGVLSRQLLKDRYDGPGARIPSLLDLAWCLEATCTARRVAVGPDPRAPVLPEAWMWSATADEFFCEVSFLDEESSSEDEESSSEDEDDYGVVGDMSSQLSAGWSPGSAAEALVYAVTGGSSGSAYSMIPSMWRGLSYLDNTVRPLLLSYGDVADWYQSVSDGLFFANSYVFTFFDPFRVSLGQGRTRRALPEYSWGDPMSGPGYAELSCVLSRKGSDDVMDKDNVSALRTGFPGLAPGSGARWDSFAGFASFVSEFPSSAGESQAERLYSAMQVTSSEDPSGGSTRHVLRSLRHQRRESCTLRESLRWAEVALSSLRAVACPLRLAPGGCLLTGKAFNRWVDQGEYGHETLDECASTDSHGACIAAVDGEKDDREAYRADPDAAMTGPVELVDCQFVRSIPVQRCWSYFVPDPSGDYEFNPSTGEYEPKGEYVYYPVNTKPAYWAVKKSIVASSGALAFRLHGRAAAHFGRRYALLLVAHESMSAGYGFYRRDGGACGDGGLDYESDYGSLSRHLVARIPLEFSDGEAKLPYADVVSALDAASSTFGYSLGPSESRGVTASPGGVAEGLVAGKHHQAGSGSHDAYVNRVVTLVGMALYADFAAGDLVL